MQTRPPRQVGPEPPCSGSMRGNTVMGAAAHRHVARASAWHGALPGRCFLVGAAGNNRSAGSASAAALALLLQSRSRAVVRRQLAEYGGDSIRALRAVARSPAQQIERLLAACAASEVRLLGHQEPAFPARLRCIPDPPLVVYLAGNLDAVAGPQAPPAIAIVGARRASVPGREIAATLSRALAAAGFWIVSGLALGIDSAAHEGALASGRTIAVLGSGLARVQPVTNLRLARRLLDQGGLMVSEYPLARNAERHHFPERNRLISGLADAVVVVEAGERSGSLITARLALEQGREVLAVPGSVNAPLSRGVNQLIKQGAGLVEEAQDVLDALGHLTPDTLPPQAAREVDLSPGAVAVLSHMPGGIMALDEICGANQISAAAAAVLLTELELGGFVARSGGGYIRRPNR